VIGDETRTPRWVKVFALVALVLVVLAVVGLVIGGSEHGPGRHAPSGDNGGHTGPPPGVTHP
jgi:hypothetical protein